MSEEKLQPVGESISGLTSHHLSICVNVHCSMNGADELVEHLRSDYGIEPDVTNETGLSLEITYCFGECDYGPNIEIDGDLHEGVSPEDLDRLISQLD